MYTYISTLVHMHTCMHMYIHIHIHIYMYIYTHLQLLGPPQYQGYRTAPGAVRPEARPILGIRGIQVYWAHMHIAYMQICIFICMYIYIYIYIYTYT